MTDLLGQPQHKRSTQASFFFSFLFKHWSVTLGLCSLKRKFKHNMQDGEWGEGEEIWGDCWITLPRKQENKNRPYCQSGEGTNNCLARLTRWKFTGQKSHQMKVYWMKVHQTKVSYDESLPDKKSRQTKIHWTKVSSDEGSPDKSLLDEGSPDKSSLQKWKGEQKLPNLHALGITTMPHVLNAPCTECPISNCSRHMTRGNSAYSAVFGWLKRGNSAYSVVLWRLKRGNNAYSAVFG